MAIHYVPPSTLENYLIYFFRRKETKTNILERRYVQKNVNTLAHRPFLVLVTLLYSAYRPNYLEVPCRPLSSVTFSPSHRHIES